MNVLNLLSQDAPPSVHTLSTPEATQMGQQRAHQYPTRHAISANQQSFAGQRNIPGSANENHNGNIRPGYESLPPTSALPKNVAFELLFDGPNTRARLPMRVQIFPHDTTDSIVTTVKNFYGLYDGAAAGVSFEDERGNTLIARYENLMNEMTVYVRVIPDYSQQSLSHGRAGWNSAPPTGASRVPRLDEAFQMPPPQLSQTAAFEQPVSRPSSRVARKRDPSPRANNHGRSVSAPKHRARSGVKSRDASLPRDAEEPNSDAGYAYSDSDGGTGSVGSSRKTRSELLASAEISVDNIVEGGRRKRAKFESSELPLFVPPQMPAANSISSISPQRRSNGQDNPSPFARPLQRAYTYSQPLQSPQSYGYSDNAHGIVTAGNTSSAVPIPASHGHRLRERPNASRQSYPGSAGGVPRPQALGILPTPDPTVASCISDEDVALQLMRLGDASNISHGRTSASTLDDALSGRADAASSATSDSDEESEVADPSVLPERRSDNANGFMSASHHMKSIEGKADGEHQYDQKQDGFFKNDPEDLINGYGESTRLTHAGTKGAHAGAQKSRSNSSFKKTSRRPPGAGQKRSKIPSLSTASRQPISPASTTSQPRKTSSASTLNFQHHPGVDEEDLSSKPRCQRCRKSKKGCDRQRPCQRCKDAGIGVEGCVSEDEGNGRKGRFGRHMGVSVKKDGLASSESQADDATLTSMDTNVDKSKKRKR
ncbi:MAG: hypothetical protein LQ341_002441 [Variospora aurantia]|nr:MAG: hypothetical protein LQ341_002441 [Variospora aurantia]